MILDLVAIGIALTSVGVNLFFLRPNAKKFMSGEAKEHIDSIYHMHETKTRVLRDEAKHALIESQKTRNSAMDAANWAQAALARSANGQ